MKVQPEKGLPQQKKGCFKMRDRLLGGDCVVVYSLHFLSLSQRRGKGAIPFHDTGPRIITPQGKWQTQRKCIFILAAHLFPNFFPQKTRRLEDERGEEKWSNFLAVRKYGEKLATICGGDCSRHLTLTGGEIKVGSFLGGRRLPMIWENEWRQAALDRDAATKIAAGCGPVKITSPSSDV